MPTATDTLDVSAVDPDVKTCENPACGVEFRRPTNRSRAYFAERRFCSRTCSGAVLRERKRPAPPEPLGISVTPPGQLWRPPGWSQTPNVGRPSPSPRPGCA